MVSILFIFLFALQSRAIFRSESAKREEKREWSWRREGRRDMMKGGGTGGV